MKMVTPLSKGWIWVLSLNILNWVFEKGIMEQKGWSFGGTGKLGDKPCWGKVVNGDWSMCRVYQVFGSVKVWGSWRKRLLVVWIVAGAIGSLWIFTYLNSKTTYKRQETLSSMCEERVRMLQDQFNVSVNHVHALAILVSTFHHGKRPSAIDQKTFAQYTARTAFERPLTSGVAYAQKVLHSEREEFEKQQGWTIKRMIEDEQNPVREDGFAEFQEISPVHEEYAPVIFAQETVEHVISIDMLSGKEDRENILRARASGRGVLTAPFKLLKSNRLGVILTFAVYSKELPSNAPPMERIEASIGYIGGIFDIGSLVDKLLHQLASTQTILVNVYDTTNASNPINMYGPSVLDNRLCHVSSIYFGDPFRQYEMHCRFNQKHPPIPWFAIIASLAAFVIEVLIGYIFYAAVARIVKVEDDYHEMMALKVRAEAADIAKSQFLATVSHEIRTPMTGVLGMLDQLMDTNLDATQQDFVRTAQASGKALVSLINQVLDQAKIESGNIELESVHFDLRGVLDEVLSLFSGKSQKKGIELAVYVSEKVPRVIVGDPCRFRQIITNLVGNSIKFTEKGHIFVSVHLVEEVRNSVEVYAEPLYEDGTRMSSVSSHNTLSGFPVVDKRRSWQNFKSFTSETPTYNQMSSSPDVINLLVSVEDTGIGIFPEAQARVFTPFMQADSSTSRIHGGTGIGLSISKRFIELMKGEIGFVSEPHVGSTFSFTAVFSKGQANQKEPKAHHQQNGDDLAIPEIQKSSALVIDTRPTRATVTKYHLQRLSIEVEVSCDVHQAFTRIAKGGARHIDFILIEKETWIEKSDILSAAFSTKTTGTNGRHVPPKLFILASSIDYKGVSAARSSGCEIQQIMKPLRANMLATSLRGAMVVGTRGNQRPMTSSKSILRGKKILVVDDNSVNLIIAARMLKKYGADVECVDSGKRAIMELTPPHTFDACFMDIQMPEIDGFKATRRIRDMEDHANQALKVHGNVSHWHTPILAMTADVIQATYDQCRKCGMDGYVSKPFDESQLYGEVTKFFPLNPSSDQ